MAVKHILSLDIPSGDCSSNCELLSIIDTSQYNSNLGVSCPEISITPPGFNSPKIIELQFIWFKYCKENFKYKVLMDTKQTQKKSCKKS